MSYSKLNLKNGEKLNEMHLAHIEEGIAATEAELVNKAAKTDIPDISKLQPKGDYALKSEIPDVSGFANYDEVQDLIDAIIPTTEKVHQMLTINGDGEKVWEDKLCYTYEEECIIHEGFTVPAGTKIQNGLSEKIIETISKDETYTIIWDNQEYICVAYEHPQLGTVLGNASLANMGENTGEPFFIVGWYGLNLQQLIFTADDKGHVCGGATGKKIFYTPINGNHIGGGVYRGKAAGATVIGSTGHAMAIDSVAVNGAIAEGVSSFAEGFGQVHADATYGHAEGYFTHVYGMGGHAEGYGTHSYGKYQHVQGKSNIKDEAGKYAHIVGNGSSETRSNAHTIDWSGNAWFSGDIYVSSTSGTNQDDGSKKVATEEYVDSQRLGYSEVNEEAVFPEQNLHEILEFDSTYYNGPSDFFPVIGQEYTVTVNGIEYKLVAQQGYDEAYFGNYGLFEDGGSSEIPWLVTFSGTEMYFIWEDESNTPTTLSITGMAETVYPIDTKYLPIGINGVLPVVELKVKPYFGSTIGVISGMDSKKIKDALARKTPCIFIFDIDYGYVSGTNKLVHFAGICNYYHNNLERPEFIAITPYERIHFYEEADTGKVKATVFPVNLNP